MKQTRFTDILKVKKQKLSEVERELLDVQNRKKRIELKVEQVDEEVASLETPKSGDFGTLQMSRQSFLYLIQQKEVLIEKLALRIQQIEGLKELYKEANIEYEKIAYLDADEIKKEMKRIADEESKELDEIANILFVNKREKVAV